MTKHIILFDFIFKNLEWKKYYMIARKVDERSKQNMVFRTVILSNQGNFH